jgi:photosystem II stability/assembly factor-like uncharacterized protein
MIIAKTYTVGDKGTVRKLVDLTTPWVDVSVALTIPNTSSYPLFDVETDPDNGDKVFAVGRGASSGSVFGIYVSTDAGATWYIPGGNYQTNTVQGLLNWYEVHVLDSNNIMVSGHNGYVAISNDGGLTFNLTSQLPSLVNSPGGPSSIPNVLSLHFITPTIGVVGLIGHVAKTINGGLTWVILNGGNIIQQGLYYLINARGIHLSSDQQTIVVLGETAIFQSLNGGITWANVYTFAQRQGQHLTWINDQELWAFANFGERVKSIDSGSTWSILDIGAPGFSDQLAGHFYFNQNGFFSQNTNILSTNNGALSGVVSEVQPNGVNAVWTFFRDTCYILTPCTGSLDPIIVNNDLSLYVGDVIRICPGEISNPALTECTCFSITQTQGCEGSITLPFLNIYDTCQECALKCYVLVDCTDVTNTIVTSDDFLEYVGQVVKLSECPDTCWQVLESLTCTGSVCVSEVIESFTTCVACLPPVPPPPPLELHPRRVKPGYYTAGCSPEYTEKISCNFAESMYSKMLVDRYGLTICCENDWTNWRVKKVLLDFKAIYDPALCKCYLQECCPPTCVEAILQVFTPVYCLAPENVSAILDY